MLYEMLYYHDMKMFNEDARRRNRMVKEQVTPLGQRLWWKVEQVVFQDDGNIAVLWSRPEPLTTK